MIGISAFGAYIPRARLQRSAIAAANTWFDASLGGHAKGERSMCNWDEDAVTMAVEAGRDANNIKPEVLVLASTSLPFADRQNAGIVSEAMNLGADLRTMDVTGSQRAGTTALLSALDTVVAGREALVIAAEHRRTRVGSPSEMLFGDAAAAIGVGETNVVARFLGGHTISSDFIDHFRGEGSEFDYDWEERWVRDEGYLKLVPSAVSGVLEASGIEPGAIDRLILTSPQRRVAPTVAKRLGIRAEALVDGLHDGCGFCGAAHPLLLLAHTLEQAEAGEHILVVGFGQGCDALLFETIDGIADAKPKRGVTDYLNQRVPEENYAKFQTFNHLVEREFGKRAEVDRSAALSAHNRNRAMVNGFIGGRCTECGTVQFPRAHYCVNPECGAAGSQVEHPMASQLGKVLTWTADRLTFDLNPPAFFGLVEFDEGGRTMLDFTEVDPQSFDIGTAVSLHFRIKHVDPRRGYRTYFWKAAPL